MEDMSYSLRPLRNGPRRRSARRKNRRPALFCRSVGRVASPKVCRGVCKADKCWISAGGRGPRVKKWNKYRGVKLSRGEPRPIWSHPCSRPVVARREKQQHIQIQLLQLKCQQSNRAVGESAAQSHTREEKTLIPQKLSGRHCTSY